MRIKSGIYKIPKKSTETIYDMTIQPGMNIQINVPVLYDDFTEKSGQWDGGDYDKRMFV
ncbi:hypothetical protein P7H15_23215 [Paenibacillus larvae]|nr:hypothetical protein [Paenibacillus larvae]MDT2295130.1 hypothetical protein [Paenibacillus larvae]